MWALKRSLVIHSAYELDRGIIRQLINFKFKKMFTILPYTRIKENNYILFLLCTMYIASFTRLFEFQYFHECIVNKTTFEVNIASLNVILSCNFRMAFHFAVNGFVQINNLFCAVEYNKSYLFHFRLSAFQHSLPAQFFLKKFDM